MSDTILSKNSWNHFTTFTRNKGNYICSVLRKSYFAVSFNGCNKEVFDIYFSPHSQYSESSYYNTMNLTLYIIGKCICNLIYM